MTRLPEGPYIGRLSPPLVAMFLILALAWSAPAPVRAAHEPLRCTAPEEITRFAVPLPGTARAIRQGRALSIVAIGSSSPEGLGASDAAHAYPALLAQDLRRRWPRLAVTMVNKGISGEGVSQMVARFERDVLAYRPQLAIWQTGSQHALGAGDIEAYAGALREGIGRLKTAGLDVLLMDPQFAPRVLARPVHARVVDAIATAGRDLKVALFPRFALMRHWVSSGQYRMDELVTDDGLHLTDVGYGCVARQLADGLAAAAQGH
ncbi:MAG TPA: SGNH/GDSL hydrolase family protein [Methylomirabilota bacterium]|nr:SGNH/GDSL hydrolase family protein [Methylomirabilota bacterium]